MHGCIPQIFHHPPHYIIIIIIILPLTTTITSKSIPHHVGTRIVQLFIQECVQREFGQVHVRHGNGSRQLYMWKTKRVWVSQWHDNTCIYSHIVKNVRSYRFTGRQFLVTRSAFEESGTCDNVMKIIMNIIIGGMLMLLHNVLNDIIMIFQTRRRRRRTQPQMARFLQDARQHWRLAVLIDGQRICLYIHTSIYITRESVSFVNYNNNNKI